MNAKSGQQSIGCEVTSCEYHSQGNCDLSNITVQPCSGECTGNAADETLCGSYKSKQ